MRRIVVGIPTYNEADTIGHVVRSADEGLELVTRACGPLKAKIVNSDSLSQNGTARTFSEVQTLFPRQQVHTIDDPGKGKNVRRLLNIAAEFEADCLLLLDGDLYSVRPEWLPALILPVLRDGVDLVLPRYARNRFEGSTTNHFCVPLIYSVFGRFVRQPIAGDFGLSRGLVDLVLQNEWPTAADYYGVDITLTITALKASRSWTEVRLEQKLHKPSFPKISYMFPQVCDAALWMLKRTNIAPRAEAITAGGESFNNNVAFPFDERTTMLLDQADRAFRAWSQANEIQFYGVSHVVKLIVESIRKGVPLEAEIYSELWCDALVEAVRAAISPSDEPQSVGSILLPAFLIKTCSFWAKVRSQPPKKVEAHVLRLAEQLRQSIRGGVKETRG